MAEIVRTCLIVLLIGLTSVAGAQDTRTYFITDDSGSPVLATDDFGNVIWEEDYLPYGERQIHSTNATDNNRWFANAPQNVDTGLVDLGSRHYDPVAGRFYGFDPVGVSASQPFTFNRYSYANNNPYSLIDPAGQSVWTKLLKLAKNGGDLSLTLYGAKQDWDTLNDPTASFGDHLIAGLSLASELLPVSGRDFAEGAGAISALARRSDGVPKRLLGRSGRDALGETRLRGLNQNRPLADLTDTDIRKTFAGSPLSLSDHAVSRILDSRTRALGAQTPNDIARLLNNGVVRDAGGGDIAIQLGRLEAIVNPATKVVDTIRPFRPR